MLVVGNKKNMIHPFTVHIEQEKLDDLKSRLERTRWPDEIPNSGWNYGANLDFMKDLHYYWLTQYNWRQTEKEINLYNNYIAEIDGNKIHFIHQKGKGKNPIPIIITHGWPGSFLEMMKILPLLTQDSEITFDVIIPSMIGYGFSSKFTKEGCNVGYMADLWVKLMKELGYGKFAVQGGDFGAGVSTAIAYKYPEYVMGIHLNYIPGNYVPDIEYDALTQEEKDYMKSEEEWYFREGGYSLQQKTKPITLAYGINDSPVGLCAWIVEKMLSWADYKDDIETAFTKDELLANVTLYWLTETIHSSIRLYGENSKYPIKLGKNDFITAPLGIARFQYEAPFPPRCFVERGFKNILHWANYSSGGHFAALEKPQELANDIKDFFSKISFRNDCP
ncbi:MAG TPA: epoxide hydrolase [Pricia sp.]|nr:epoxide hydrolase [Pricia sp.]